MLIIDNITEGGSLSKTHGYKGFLRAVLKDGIKFRKKLPDFFFLMINKKLVPFAVKEMELLDQRSFLLKFVDVDSKEEAVAFAGMTFYLKKDNCEFTSAFNPSDLIAFEVFDQHGKSRKHIAAIFKNPAHYLIELDDGSLVPLHEDLILSIDMENRILRLEIAEGL